MLSGTIRRRDRRALGSPDHVKTQTSKAFPGTRFVLIHAEDFPRPSGLGLSFAALLIWLNEPEYPYREGGFEGDGFAAVFEIGEKPVIKSVRVSLYGVDLSKADGHFAIPSKQTDWIDKF